MRSFMIIRVNESCYTKYSKELLRLMCDIMCRVPITLNLPPQGQLWAIVVSNL